MNRRGFFGFLGLLLGPGLPRKAIPIGGRTSYSGKLIKMELDTTDRPLLTSKEREELIHAIKRQYRAVRCHDNEPLVLDALIVDTKRIKITPREMDFRQG